MSTLQKTSQIQIITMPKKSRLNSRVSVIQKFQHLAKTVGFLE